MQCPSCGNENREEARFCDSCGATLAGAPATEAARSGQEALSGPALPEGSPESVADGRFRIEGYLGEGGRKRVYLAEDTEAGSQVALAIFNTEGVGAAIGARARREAQAMGKLGEHPHLVSVTSTGEQDGDPYIVSEYMPGGDVEGLLDAAEQRRLPTERAIAIATDVTRALEHAHGRGIVHRDIKPANVWLGEDGLARLGDFGLATTEGRSRVSEAGTLVGTVAYLPPEQALGHAAGPRADLYSLGALLYEMLSGHPPFRGDDAVSIIGQHINADPVPPSRHADGVPVELDRLVIDLLAKRPEQRPATAAEVRERLREAAEAEPPAEAGSAPEDEHNPLDSLAGGIFIGREAEVEELRDSVDEASAGHGRLMLLVGEPGIGKTRTADELATYARLRGARVHWGRCREDEGAPAYWPWVQAIRSYVRDADPVALAWELGAGAAEIAQLVPEVAERIGRELPEASAEGEEARFRLFDSVTNFLTSAARDRPIVLVLDDLHWADESSLLLLKFIARELGGSRLLILGTYRDIELGRHHPLAGVLSELAEADAAQRVMLRGLDPAAVERYIGMSSGSAAPPGLAEAVHAQTDGNPFFVSEVVRLLASEGSLGEGGGGRSWSLAIPQGVREVVGRRLDQLPPGVNSALGVAAVVGREFDVDLLARVLDIEADQFAAGAEISVAARLVLPTEVPGRYSFAHALVRETLYEELSAPQRAQLHARIAETIEELHPGDPDRLGDLAHHYLEAGSAGNPDLAIDYATLAAGRAVEQLAFEEGAELYAKAIEVFELGERRRPAHRLALLLALGDAQTLAGELDQARETLWSAVEVARELDDADTLARAALGLGRISEVGSVDERLVALLEEGLDRIGEGDGTTRAQMLAVLAQEVYWSDPQGRSRELVEESVAMARRLDDPDTLVATLHRGIFTAIGPGSTHERLAVAEEIASLAERTGDREHALRASIYRLRELLELGDIAAVDREIELYARLAAELRIPQHLWHVPVLRAMRALIDGDLESAERYAEEARLGGERAGEPLAGQFYGIQITQIRLFQGRLDELVGTVRGLAERYPAIRAWRVALANLYARLGRVEDARAEFERLAARDFADIPADAQWVSAMELLADVCFVVADRRRAQLLYDALLPYEGIVLVPARAAASHGPVSRQLGQLAALLGRHAESAAHFERALELATRMGDRPYAALIRTNHAGLLLAQGNRERALELLGEALEDARELRLAGLVEPALALRLEAQGLAGVDISTSIDEVISAVESEQPDLRAHAAPDGRVTILFSDIEDSTIHTERLGDERWLELLREHNRIFRERISEHDGYEVKNQGDGFMLAFPDPRRALDCAIAVQRDFAARAAGGEPDALRVRIGLHSGEVIAEDGDFFGKNVILAARIAARAQGGEILVSSSLREVAGEERRFDDGRELELKGLAGTHRVFRAAWEPQAAAA